MYISLYIHMIPYCTPTGVRGERAIGVPLLLGARRRAVTASTRDCYLNTGTHHTKGDMD